MNQSTAKSWLPLVQALSEGKVIQMHTKERGWVDLSPGAIHFLYEVENYRIKPEPREIWVNEYPFNDPVIHMSETRAKEALRKDGVTRRYREVIE